MKPSLLAALAAVFLALTVVTAASAQAKADLSAQDVNYLQTSISGDRFEIIGGKLALQKKPTPQVRALAMRLIKDHSKSLQESISEAKQFGIEVPKAPTPSEVWELRMVSGLDGPAFDRAYSFLELKDHQQDIKETSFEVVHGGNGEIKQSAQKELPVLRLHLSLSKRARVTA